MHAALGDHGEVRAVEHVRQDRNRPLPRFPLIPAGGRFVKELVHIADHRWTEGVMPRPGGELCSGRPQ